MKPAWFPVPAHVSSGAWGHLLLPQLGSLERFKAKIKTTREWLKILYAFKQENLLVLVNDTKNACFLLKPHFTYPTYAGQQSFLSYMSCLIKEAYFTSDWDSVCYKRILICRDRDAMKSKCPFHELWPFFWTRNL